MTLNQLANQINQIVADDGWFHFRVIDAASLFHEYLCLPDQHPSDLAVGIISRIVMPSGNVV
jgi:hypothetical protein